MGFSISVCSLFVVSALLLTSEIEVGVADKTFSVLDYGAVGDGLTNDSPAFIKAWNDACNTNAGTSTVSVPQGKQYHLSTTNFTGPCQCYINLVVAGKITAPKDPNAWKGQDQSKWLTFQSVNGLNISGPGSFDGNGKAWWDVSCKMNPKPGCNMLAPTDDVKYYGLEFAHFKDKSNIRKHKLMSGDDCISIGDQTSDMKIANIDCGPGHGISIGSLGMSGNEVSVKNVEVSKVNFHGTTNGARIKTWQVGRGQVSQITFADLNFTGVENPIIIDQYYCNTPNACPSTETGVQISDVHYQRAFGTSSTKVAINLNCSDRVPCTNINLDTVKLDSAIQGEEPISSCNNAFGTAKGMVKPNSCLRRS